MPPAVLAAPSIPFPGAIAPQFPFPKIPGSQVTASPLNPSLDNAPLSPAGADSSAPPPIPGTVPRVVNPYELDTYRLAIGDSISIFVANVPEFTTKNVIMSDGTVNLPVAGSLSLWGMTLAEATQAVTERYVQTDVLRKPFIAVQLLASSPLKIALSGAINRPGAYNIPVVDTKLPTITDAIAFAGGITGTADLKQVKVYRLSPNGTDQVLDVNLWALIQNADLRQDITLRSGDRILLQRAPVQPEEASLIGSANLSPTDMQVGILGEVLSPGLVKVPPNTSLNQALLLVGGFNRRAQVKTVELIRANPDGSVTRRKYPVRWSDSISENANPILQHRDVVLVGSSTLARYGDILSKILSPISQSFSFLNFFNFLFPATK
ncbi:MAG: SLBB domain-containing protein [Thermosynechococcaceae cyanobacterium MS004]|nr:SLBB domain-containing protein [Thermosynechococcaceae cyanobacterium MS004]